MQALVEKVVQATLTPQQHPIHLQLVQAHKEGLTITDQAQIMDLIKVLNMVMEDMEDQEITADHQEEEAA
jgi:hypothetical protein